MVRDVGDLFRRIHRDPSQYSLFARIWEALQFAPSSRHTNEEEMVSLAVDALDYLVTDGEWTTASTTGRTALQLQGDQLCVYEEAGDGWHHHRCFDIFPVQDA